MSHEPAAAGRQILTGRKTAFSRELNPERQVIPEAYVAPVQLSAAWKAPAMPEAPNTTAMPVATMMACPQDTRPTMAVIPSDITAIVAMALPALPCAAVTRPQIPLASAWPAALSA